MYDEGYRGYINGSTWYNQYLDLQEGAPPAFVPAPQVIIF